MRLAKEHQCVGDGENAALKTEVSPLNAKLKQANEKRDVLKKTATDFAELSE